MTINNNDISDIKDMLQKRETYIRFSPAGTTIMGIMYILYFMYASNFFAFLGLESHTVLYTSRPEIYVQNGLLDGIIFLGIGLLGIVIVTILSIMNSKKRGEELFPKSIKYVVKNMMLVLIVSVITFYPYLLMFTFSMPGQGSDNQDFSELYTVLILLVFLFYGFLILISRLFLPKYIKYFGLVLFFTPFAVACSYFFIPYDISENIKFSTIIHFLILILFGFGHLLMGYLLHKDNK